VLYTSSSMPRHSKKKLGATLTRDGVEFGVWAPFAKSVGVVINDSFESKETALIADGKGYWYGEVPDVQVGQTYKYHIRSSDDQDLYRNDPYARQLTDSDVGSSVIVDAHVDWENAVQPNIPLNQQIIYELHVGTFNRPDPSTPGTFVTAIEKLDYLQQLGVNMIEVMPVTCMGASMGWGYNPTHLFAIENSYGGRRGLLDFIIACHQRNIGVIIDVVYNHFYHSDLWQFDGWSENDRGGIYFYNDERGDTPWGARPDYGRPEVRQYILDNVAMWLTEYKVDGLRLDSTTYLRNTRGAEGDLSTAIPEAWTLLQEITSLGHKINEKATLIAEDSSGDAAITAPIDQNGAGFDAQWGISFPQGIRQSLGVTNVNPYQGSLKNELEKYYNGKAFQKVIFGDSHDSAANGAVRVNEAATPGNATSVFARQYDLIANAVTLTAPGIPMILQGEEFMQPGNFNDWRMLDWENTSRFAGIVLAHQHLINLRLNTFGNTSGLLGEGLNIFHQDSSNNVLAYHRWAKGGIGDDVLVIINFSDQRFKEYQLRLPVGGSWRVRFNSSWQGYSADFNQTDTDLVTPDEHGTVTIALADFNILLLSQE